MSATFNLNKSNLITRACQKANIISDNQVPNSSQSAVASDLLNLMIKKLECDGINLWKRKLGYLFPAYTISNYSLGLTGDNCTNSYISTTISTAQSLGDTTLNLISTDGMTANDYIGIELDDNTRQWTTIVSITNSTSLVITNSLLTTAAATNTVITYTTKISRPLQILRGTIKDLKNNGSETKLQLIGYDEYFDLPVKTTLGRPNNFYYDKLLNGSTPYTGTLYLYPVTQSVFQILTFSYKESLADAINSTDYLDFPQEAIGAIWINLVVEIAEFYGKYSVVQALQAKASAELEKLHLNDSDDAMIRIHK